MYDAFMTTEGMERHGENDTSENHVNSREVSDDPNPNNREVSGSGSKDAVLGGLEDNTSQQPMGDYVNVTTKGMCWRKWYIDKLC